MPAAWRTECQRGWEQGGPQANFRRLLIVLVTRIPVAAGVGPSAARGHPARGLVGEAAAGYAARSGYVRTTLAWPFSAMPASVDVRRERRALPAPGRHLIADLLAISPRICGMTSALAKSVGGLAEPVGEVVVQVLLIVADPGDVAVGA